MYARTRGGGQRGQAMVGLADTRDQRSLSTRFRQRRDVLLRQFIARLRAETEGPLRILDIGGTLSYWQRVDFDFIEANDLEITCSNLEAGEFGDVALNPRFKLHVGDARHLPFADNAFHMVHSNSVIEHVGRFNDMAAYADEVRRLAPAYYVQTPYCWFPVDPHFYRMPFFHWLPESVRLKLVRTFKLGWARPVSDVAHGMRIVESAVLLDRLRFRTLFPDAKILFERVVGLPKSLLALRGYDPA